MKNWVFAMLVAAFSLSSCSKENEERECPSSTERTFDATGFIKVTAGETFTINIIKGNNFGVKASGCENDLNDLSVQIVGGGFLELKYKNYRKNRYHVVFTITMPEIRSVNLSGVAKGKVTGFGDQQTFIWAILSGASELLLDGNPEDLQFDISGAAQLTATGPVVTLKGVVSGAGELHAFDTPADEVDISVSGTGLAQIQPIHSLNAEASGASRIIYRGNPAVKDLSISGTAKITKE